MNEGAYMEKVKHSHETLLENVRTKLPTELLLEELADLFKVFGDSTRIKILYALLKSEMCVCAISEMLGMQQSAISHQLKVLKTNNLVDFKREGKTRYYHLADEHVRLILEQGFDHLTEEE